MVKYKKSSLYQQQGSMDRLVCERPSRLNSLDPINAYSFWNKPNTTRFGYWGSPMDRSSLHKQVSDRPDPKVTEAEAFTDYSKRTLHYCINCGCYPKPDQWASTVSRFCIDCADAYCSGYEEI